MSLFPVRIQPGVDRLTPASRSAPAPFLQAQRLQEDATFQYEQWTLKGAKLCSTPFRRALLTAAGAPHASDFLFALPTQSAYTLDSDSMRLAVCHRLGLPPSPSLPKRGCVCGALFSADPDHFHSCVYTRSSSLTQRHDHLVATLAGLARSCGFHVTHEPNHHLRPPQPTAAQSDGAAAAAALDLSDDLPAHYNRHGDLLLLKNALKLYIDVSVARPTNASSLSSQPAV